jgi:hypothetical protein
MPSFSTIYNTKGVKYVKVNKISSNGLDRTAYLEQLQSLNIRFDDVGVVEYQITSAQQFDEYYLFGIDVDQTLTNQYGVLQYPISSSTDNEIKDYHLDARKNYSSFYLLSSSIGLIPPSPITVSSIINYTSIPIDASNYFTTSSGLYRFFMSAKRTRNFDDFGYPDEAKTLDQILADRETVKNNP